MNPLIRSRWWLLAASVLLIGGLASGLSGLRLDNSFEIWFPEDDPALLAYQRYQRDFGSDEVIVLAVRLPVADAHTEARIAALMRLSADVEQMTGVAVVQSLASLPAFDEDDAFLDAEIERFTDLFVDASGSTYKLLVTMERRNDLESIRPALFLAIDAASRNAFPDNTGIWMAGTGVVLNALNDTTIAESAVFLPLSYGLILSLLGYLTRSWRWTSLACVVLTGANVGMFGLMGLMERPITMITMALPPIALVVTICSVLHLQRGSSNFADALKPVIFSGLTTAAGFFSLSAADMAITRDYGLFAGVVILLSLVLTVGGACFMRRCDRVGDSRATPPADRLAGFLESSIACAMRHRRVVVAGYIGLVGLAAFHIANLNVDTHSIGFLSSEHRARSDSDDIEATFGPYIPLEFILHLGTPTDASSERVLTRIYELQQQVMRRVASLGDSFSYVDALVAGEIIEDYGAAADVHGIEPSRWIDEQRTRIRMNWTVPMASANELAKLKNQILEAGRDALPSGMTLTATGYLPLYSRLIDRVVTDQVQSLSIAMLVVFALIALLMRDVRMCIVAVTINVLPIVLLLASMALLEIPLDIATVTVAPAMLGLIVDDSIHLLYHYRRRRHEGTTLDAAVLANARTVGRTLVMTSFVLVIGFGVLGFSAISSISTNGLLMAWTVVLALGSDLFLLPAVAALLEPKGISRNLQFLGSSGLSRDAFELHKRSDRG